MRAARFTVAPNKSSSSRMTSPVVSPDPDVDAVMLLRDHPLHVDRTGDGATGRLEGEHEAVAGALDLDAAMLSQLRASEIVDGAQRRARVLVTDDVGELR